MYKDFDCLKDFPTHDLGWTVGRIMASFAGSKCSIFGYSLHLWIRILFIYLLNSNPTKRRTWKIVKTMELDRKDGQINSSHGDSSSVHELTFFHISSSGIISTIAYEYGNHFHLTIFLKPESSNHKYKFRKIKPEIKQL